MLRTGSDNLHPRTFKRAFALSAFFLMVGASVCAPAQTKKAPAKASKSAAARSPKKTVKPTETVEARGTIKSIEIKGNRKIEKDAIMLKIQSKVGEAYSSEKIREDVTEVFKLGYFLDIKVDLKGSGNDLVLTYEVTEKPSISEIVYEGNSELKNEDLAEALGVKAYQILNMDKLKAGVEKMQKLYEDKGYFLAKVDYEVTDVKKDENVKVTFRIKENDKVKVKKITFIGNNKLGDGFLKSKMLTTEGGYFSALSGSGQYKQEMFDRDVQILRFAYYNQGYVQAKIDRPQVYVTPDKKNIYISIKVEEGEQYDVGEVDFAGDLLFSRQELSDSIEINKNKVFAYDVLQKDISNLTAKYGDLGYAYANVIPRYRFNDKERKVDLVFEFDKGNKVYFGRVNVVGNSKTRDKVVRRELKIKEGELYNETRRRESVENIQRLGFFDEVNFKTSVDPQRTDIMNVDIVVKERNTGQIQLGAGYGSATGFSLQGSVNQTNFLGKGQNLGASVNLSGYGNYYSLSFTEPYFNDTLWSVGFNAYSSANTGRLDFDELHQGGSMTFGHPVSEFTRAFLRTKYDKAELKGRTDVNGQNITDPDLYPLSAASGETISTAAIMEYDTRNDRFSPTKGIFASASYEYAGLGQLKFQRSNATLRFFKNLFWDVTFRNSLQVARIEGLNDRDVPFSELYLLGGPYSLRGYRIYRVGKSKFSNLLFTQYKTANPAASDQEARDYATRPYGGTNQALYQGELQFPIIKEAQIMGVVFYDTGLADDVFSDGSLYSDVGFGIRWFSPIGPLRFEWGFPLNRNSLYYEPTVFEFSIGTPF